MSLQKIVLPNRDPTAVETALKNTLDYYKSINQSVKCAVMDTKNNTCSIYVYPRENKPRKPYKKRSYGGSRGNYKPRTKPTKPYKPRTQPTPRKKYGHYAFKPVKKLDWEQLANIANILNTELGITTEITPEQVEQIVQAKLQEIINTRGETINAP